jgi:hypothetical protein
MRSLWNEENERRGMEAMRIEPMPTIHETLNKMSSVPVATKKL